MKQRIEKFGATAALTGALLGTVACSPEAPRAVKAPEEAGVTLVEVLGDSPRNRVGRCVLQASKLAILDVMDSPITVYEPAKSGNFAAYVFTPESSPSDTSSVIIDDSVSGETSFTYYINARGDNQESFVATGKLTLPVHANEAVESLENLDPTSLAPEEVSQAIDFQSSSIVERTAIGETNGTTIQKTYTPEAADANCEVVEEFIEQIQ